MIRNQTYSQYWHWSDMRFLLRSLGAGVDADFIKNRQQKAWA